MEKCKTSEDPMKQKLKKLNEVTKPMEKYAAVAQLSPLSSGGQIGHDLKEMGKAQDEFFRCCDAVFKKEQQSSGT